MNNTEQPTPEQQPAPPLVDATQMHYLESFDALANIAKSTKTYHAFMNAMLVATAVVLSEIKEPQVADGVFIKLRKHVEELHQQRVMRAANVAQPTGATNVQ